MVNQEVKESKALHSSGTNICSRNKGMQIPCKGPKSFKNAKVKFLSTEEAIKLRSGTPTAKKVLFCKRCPQSKTPESLTVPKRTCTAAKTATSKRQSMIEDAKCSSTVFQQQGIRLKERDDGGPKQEAELGLNRGKGAAEIQENSSHLISSYSQKFPPNGPA